MTDETTVNETKETAVNETPETTGQPTPANPREVSKALKAGGRRPRNGERRDGSGGFQASAERSGQVRIVHRFGPEADDMEPGEIADLRSVLHDEYEGILRRAGYPVCDREAGAPVYVWGRGASKGVRPTAAVPVAAKAPMRIAVHLTIELPDPRAWAFNHGLDVKGGTEAAVRRDVRDMILNAVQAGIPLLEEAGAEVRLTN